MPAVLDLAGNHGDGAGGPMGFELTRVPIEARALFSRLLTEPPLAVDQLRGAAVAYTAAFVARATGEDFIDGAEAERVCAVALALLDGLPESPAGEALQLAHAAIRYFVIEGDGDRDFSMGGFSDDLAVLRAVACHLGVRLA